MADLTGEQLGPFAIHSLIGTGGFATVYRAHDPRLNDTVAVKILAENHALNAETRERFLGEAHALRRVSSPGVVQIYDIRETPDGRPYLVLEYADRGDLVGRRHSLTTNGWLPQIADLQLVVDSVAEALDAIHAEALVHRDVTPSNLLVRSSRRDVVRPDVSLLAPDERFMLSDMGLVKDLSDGSALTVGGGTAGFWAPEQQQHLTNVDHRTDVYAATALIAWVVTGHAVGISPAWQLHVDQHRFPGLLATLERGLAHEPDARQQSILQWRDELTEALRSADAVTAARHRDPLPLSATVAPAPTASPTAHVVATPPAPVLQSSALHTPVSQVPAPSGSSAGAMVSRRARVLAGLCACALAFGAAWFLLRSTTALNPTAVQQANDEIAVTVVSGPSSLAIIGPDELRVGEPATYVMEAEGIATSTWRDPAGKPWTEDTLVVEATTAGQGTVLLQGTTTAGTIVEVDLTFIARDR